MIAHAVRAPGRLAKWERWALVGLVALCVVLAVAGRGRKQREAYASFLDTAPRVAEALERYAADHGGAFPPDGFETGRPPGLSDDYIAWDEGWRIDYEVHDNGAGGHYVCLEFGGPFKERIYEGLCNDPELRSRYGRGQPVPGHPNRIWLVREQAPIAAPEGG